MRGLAQADTWRRATWLGLAGATLACSLTGPETARAQAPPQERSQEGDPANLETPLFPIERWRESLRVRAGSRFLPAARLEGTDVTLYLPDLRVRGTLPLSDRAALQLTGRFQSSRYDFERSADLFAVAPATAERVERTWATGVTLQAAVRLNDDGHLFVDEETWALLAGVGGRSRWEGDGFAEGLSGGGALAVGYQSERFRLALGVQIGRGFGDGVDLGPVVSIRWDPTDALTLRNRGLGLQAEYRLSKRFEVFAAGYREGERYRLERRPGVAGRPELSDERVQAGAGLEWRLSRRVRINLESGAVAWRRIEVQAGGRRLSRLSGGPAAYVDLRLSLRP